MDEDALRRSKKRLLAAIAAYRVDRRVHIECGTPITRTYCSHCDAHARPDEILYVTEASDELYTQAQVLLEYVEGLHRTNEASP